MRRFALVAFVCIAASGCYTVLRHPAVEAEDPEHVESVVEDDAAFAAVDRCAACHSDWELEQFDYAFHPIYVPVAWGPYYWEPWWGYELPEVIPAGTRVEQGAGMTNDRGAGGGTGAGYAPGVWIPTSGGSPPPGVVVAPPATSGPKPTVTNEPPRSIEADRAKQPVVGPPRDAAPTTTPPRGDFGTPATREASNAPAPRSSEPKSAPEPSDPKSTPESTEPPRSGTTTTTPRPPDPPPATKPDQGRGMSNDRPRGKR